RPVRNAPGHDTSPTRLIPPAADKALRLPPGQRNGQTSRKFLVQWNISPKAPFLGLESRELPMTVTEALAPHLPYLRRYGRALTGSQASGDAYVRAALTALLAGKHQLPSDLPPRVALYRLFHVIWSSSAGQLEDPMSFDVRHLTPEERLRSLSSADRAALLLTAVEGFSLSEAGRILGEAPEEVEQSIVEAQRAIERQLASRVLIIEDESIIALDLENLVTELGHKVVGTAAS